MSIFRLFSVQGKKNKEIANSDLTDTTRTKNSSKCPVKNKIATLNDRENNEHKIKLKYAKLQTGSKFNREKNHIRTIII